MKPGSLLLINVLLIGAALFLYDSLRTAPQSEPTHDQESLDPLQADDLDFGGEPDPSSGPPMLDGGGNETQVMGLNARIASLEGDLARVRRILAARASSSGTGGGDGAATGSGGSSLPAIELGDVGDLEEPTFDERTLGSIQAYMDEITRRKAVERQRNIVDAQLTRLGVELSDSQREQVVAETLAYQERAAEVNRSGWPKDEAGRDQRRQAFKALHEEYTTKISSLVPADTAEKIASSRLARSRGFVTGGASRGRGNRDNGRNRNGDR